MQKRLVLIFLLVVLLVVPTVFAKTRVITEEVPHTYICEGLEDTKLSEHIIRRCLFFDKNFKPEFMVELLDVNPEESEVTLTITRQSDDIKKDISSTIGEVTTVFGKQLKVVEGFKNGVSMGASVVIADTVEEDQFMTIDDFDNGKEAVIEIRLTEQTPVSVNTVFVEDQRTDLMVGFAFSGYLNNEPQIKIYQRNRFGVQKKTTLTLTDPNFKQYLKEEFGLRFTVKDFRGDKYQRLSGKSSIKFRIDKNLFDQSNFYEDYLAEQKKNPKYLYCELDGQEYEVGYVIEDKESTFYCDSSMKFLKTRAANTRCQFDYQCISSNCKNNLCFEQPQQPTLETQHLTTKDQEQQPEIQNNQTEETAILVKGLTQKTKEKNSLERFFDWILSLFS